MNETPAVSPLQALRSAQDRQSQLEYLISAARASTIDDKLTPETRLVLAALAIAEIGRQSDALETALAGVSAAIRAASE